MSDVTFTMDQIRMAAFTVLVDYAHLIDGAYASFTQGVIALTAKLSDVAGETATEPCLDKLKEVSR